MGKQVKKAKAEVATIDCTLITIELQDGREFGFDTANKIEVEPQIEEEDAVKLVVKGILRAQKPKVSTITGHELTLTDNVFNPELVLVLQGGEIIYDPADPDEIVGYNPPVAGSGDKGEVFKVNAYTAQYDASGQIVKYEKISYPNCQGVPVAFGSEDGAFRAPEYTINSAPRTGEPPYSLTYVKSLPILVDEYSLEQLNVISKMAAAKDEIILEIVPEKDSYMNKYMISVSSDDPILPKYGEVIATGYMAWDGKTEVHAERGAYVAVIECNEDNKALAGGVVISNAKTWDTGNIGDGPGSSES